MWCVLFGLSLVSPMLTAPGAEPESPRGQYESLIAAFKSAEGAWTNRYEPGGKPNSMDEAVPRYEAWPAWDFLTRFMKLAEEHPEDAAATDALFWIIDQGNATGPDDREFYPHLERTLGLLAQRDLFQDKRLSEGLRSVISRPSPATEAFLRIALEKAKDREIRARACLALGKLLKSRSELARHPWFDNPLRSPFQSYLAGRMHPDVLKYIRETNVAAAAEGDRFLRRAIDEFGDVVFYPKVDPAGRATTVADLALSKLQEAPRLILGQVGPEIEGTDVDGKPMTLSEYRGKVVVLSFWGSWCGPCMALVPHERELVARLADRPFVLLGINSDEDRGQARKVMDRERMSWRSWWDGPPNGPIADTWQAGPWPTLYVLDAKGCIRYRGHSQQDFGDALEVVLKEMRDASKP